MNNFGEKDNITKGKIIQEHLNNVNLDAWIYIYENFINSRNSNNTDKKADC